MKTMNKFIVNGNEVNAYYSSNDINDVLIPLVLCQDLRQLKYLFF